jgi:hypothetical protein
MAIRARVKGYNFPYLKDAEQTIAKAYGPERTPEVFVLDSARRLRYRGRIDDNAADPDDVQSFDLRDAIQAVLSGREVAVKETNPIGCSIKWKLRHS